MTSNTRSSKQLAKKTAAATSRDDAHHEEPEPSVAQMFATLLGEISALRQQNEKNDQVIRNLARQVKANHANLAMVLSTDLGALQNEIHTHSDHMQACTTTLRDEVIINRQTKSSNEGQKIWREQLVTRRKVDRLFEMMNNAGPTYSLPDFRRLPLELRRYIWRLAVPQRMTCIDEPDKYCLLPTTLSAPAIAHVCRESRAAVSARSRHPGIWAPSLPRTDVPYTELWQIRQDRGKLWTWFTPETDILLVRPDLPLAHPMKEVVQHIVIGSGDTYYNTDFGDYGAYPQDPVWPAPASEVDHVEWQNSYFEWLNPVVDESALSWRPYGKPHPWPRLHTIDLLLGGTTAVDKTYSPGFTDKLFQGDDVKLVDLTDTEAIKNILELNKEYNRTPDRLLTQPFVRGDVSDLAHHLHHAVTRFEGFPEATRFRDLPGRQFFHYAQNRIRCLYLRQHERWVPLDRSRPPSFITTADGQESPNMDIPWIRDLLGRLRIRPVHAFVLATRRDPWENGHVSWRDQFPTGSHEVRWDGRWQLQEPAN